jgi:hypothetical protein
MDHPDQHTLKSGDEEACLGVANSLDTFMDLVNPSWAMPFEEFPFDSFLKAAQEVTKAEAVSVFVLDPDRPVRLVCAAGVGYKDFYRQWTYSLDRKSLTQHVYNTRRPVNCSREELDPGNQHARVDVPHSTFRCESFLQSRFRNCVLTPLLFRHSDLGRIDEDCLGVLKFENQRGTNDANRFNASDFASARILGRVLAHTLQQWHYRQLWAGANRAQSESRKDYFDRLSRLFAKVLRVEMSAIYSASEKPEPEIGHVLTFESGIGHRLGYGKERFDTAGNSVIADVARSEVMCSRLNSGNLEGAVNDPFIRSCRHGICGGPLRNLILFPVATERKLLGVLVAGNKVGKDEFGELDEGICRIFAKCIAKDVEEFAARPRRSTASDNGFSLLEKHLGPSERRKGMALRRKARDVSQLRARSHGQITGEACAEYLQVSRAYYLKLAKLSVEPNVNGSALAEHPGVSRRVSPKKSSEPFADRRLVANLQ